MRLKGDGSKHSHQVRLSRIGRMRWRWRVTDFFMQTVQSGVMHGDRDRVNMHARAIVMRLDNR